MQWICIRIKPETVAGYALNRELYNLSDNYYETYLEKINAVTIDEVQNACRDGFQSAHNLCIIKKFKTDENKRNETSRRLDL